MGIAILQHTIWETQAIPSLLEMKISKALLLQSIRERKRIGKHLTVDASIYNCMTKLQPALEGAHGSGRCTDEQTDTSIQMLT